MCCETVIDEKDMPWMSALKAMGIVKYDDSGITQDQVEICRV
jgi:hypothetical protein